MVRRRLRNGNVQRVLAVVMRITVRVVRVRHQTVGYVRGLGVAWDRPRRHLRTGTSAISADFVSGFKRRQSAIGDRTFGLDEGLHSGWDDIAGSERISLNRVEDLSPRHLSRNEL